MGKNGATGRREFLKMTAAGAAGIALSSGGMGNIFAKPMSGAGRSPYNKWAGRVVVNFNKSALNSSGSTVNIDTVKTMVNEAIKRLTEQTDIGAAWKAIFPDTLSLTSQIAIKTNTLNYGKAAPHWSSVRAITDGLRLMDFGGTTFPAANITIYDRNNGAASDNRLDKAGYNPANFPDGIKIVTDTLTDGSDGAMGNKPYATTLKNADFLINVFSPRGNTNPPQGSQFTLGFKSHFGTYFDVTADKELMHSSNLVQFLQDISCNGPVYKKQVLNVCSGIYGMNEGNGPSGEPDVFKTYAQKIDASSTNQCPTTIIMSTDPVSAEMQSIKMMRMNRANGAFTVDDMPGYLKASAGIVVDGFSATNNIGVIDEEQMDIRRIVNGEIIAVKDPGFMAHAEAGVSISAHQIKGYSTFIDYMLSKDYFGKEATIEIVDARGSVVKKISQKVMGVRNHISWDEKNDYGSTVAKGVYFIRLSCGGARHASRFSIIR
jgi:hypothetical protein